MFRLPFDVPSSDIIPPYNHVHHAQILRYMESARAELMRKLGFPIEEYLDNGIFLVIASINVRYLREVLGGTIEISTENPRVEERACLVTQRVYNHRGKLAVEAEVDSRFVDAKNRRSIDPPSDFVEKFLQVARRAA